MKSGLKIYVRVLASEKPAKAVRRLKNGSLRALISRLDNPHGEPPCEKREHIHGHAIVEGCRRFMKAKGKGSIL